MLIRSQDGMKLVDISGTTIYAVIANSGEFKIIAYGNNQPEDTAEDLGQYPDKKRAIEVMNDISDTYQKVQMYKVSGKSLEEPEFVYYMPED